MELRTGYFVVLLFILILIPACENEVACSEDTVSRVNAGFYTLAGGKEANFTPGQLDLHGILRPDSVILYSNVSKIEFPLSMHDTVSFFVMTADTLTDTLEFRYANQIELISWECGFTNHFEIHSVIFSENFIDSIAIINPIADPSDEENLKIFI